MRIGIAGFQHETNTFSPILTDFEAFEKDKDWPGLLIGKDILDRTRNYNLPVAGAIGEFSNIGAEIVPLAWAFAVPSGKVTGQAYEDIADLILRLLSDAGSLDGLYLDLHGAMVCEHLDDGEGELLTRIRSQVGTDLPIAVSLDLHANVTRKMFDHADYIDIFRSYPHVDLAETGARTANRLIKIVSSGNSPKKAFHKPERLVALNEGCTDVEPAKSIYGEDLERASADDHVFGASIALGFHLSDIEEAGPAVLVYADDQEIAASTAGELDSRFMKRAEQFDLNCQAAGLCVDLALHHAARGHTPVVIADTQDNPGAGGTGDTTGLLRELLSAGAQGAVLGVIGDPEAVATAKSIGVGQSGKISVGGRRFSGDQPLVVDSKVKSIKNGCFTATGPMWGGAKMNLGEMALLDLAGVRVIVSEKSVQTGDCSIFRHMEIEPADEKIICLKSSVHFRADFAPFASKVLYATAPGAAVADPNTLTYRKLRPGLMLSKANGIRRQQLL